MLLHCCTARDMFKHHDSCQVKGMGTWEFSERRDSKAGGQVGALLESSQAQACADEQCLELVRHVHATHHDAIHQGNLQVSELNVSACTSNLSMQYQSPPYSQQASIKKELYHHKHGVAAAVIKRRAPRCGQPPAQPSEQMRSVGPWQPAACAAGGSRPDCCAAPAISRCDVSKLYIDGTRSHLQHALNSRPSFVQPDPAFGAEGMRKREACLQRDHVRAFVLDHALPELHCALLLCSLVCQIGSSAHR